MYEEGRFCDITFLLDGENRLKAHRVVLASFSPYFEALLGRSWDEGEQEEIRLQGINEAVFRVLIDFAYTGCVKITEENVQDLLHGANYFGVDFVQISCAEFLKKATDEKTCMGIMQLADSYGIHDLRLAAKHYALSHFVEISKEQDFLALPLQFLLEILRDDLLRVDRDGIVPLLVEREQFVLDAAFHYVNHDLGSRKPQVPQLLTCVRIPFLPTSSLETLKTHELVKDNKEAVAVVDKAISARNLPGKNLESSWTKPRDLCRQLWTGWVYANGYIRPDVTVFDDSTIQQVDDEIFLQGMKLWIRRWDGRPVLGGLKAFYSNGDSVMHGGQSATKQYEFHIGKDERITNIEVQSGWMIDNLTFFTNKKNSNGEAYKYGPYGGPGGSAHKEAPPGRFGYLAYIKGSVVHSQGTEGITKLQFVWMTFEYDGLSSESSLSTSDHYSSEYEVESEWVKRTVQYRAQLRASAKDTTSLRPTSVLLIWL